jgi:hypothetical protein
MIFEFTAFTATPITEASLAVAALNATYLLVLTMLKVVAHEVVAHVVIAREGHAGASRDSDSRLYRVRAKDWDLNLTRTTPGRWRRHSTIIYKVRKIRTVVGQRRCRSRSTKLASSPRSCLKQWDLLGSATYVVCIAHSDHLTGLGLESLVTRWLFKEETTEALDTRDGNICETRSKVLLA